MTLQTTTDVTAGAAERIWSAAQRDAFQAAMNGAPLEESLGILAQTAAEQVGGGCRCAFYISNKTGTRLHHVVGMGEAYARAVDGVLISPESLACGLAVARAAPVITPDVNEEPRWGPWLWIARTHGYRGCWSFPVETSTGKLVGSFSWYFREPRDATPRERELAAELTHTAAIIIAQHQTEAALRESEERFQQFAQASSAAIWIRNAKTLEMEYVSPAITRIYGVDPDFFRGEMRHWAALILPEDRHIALEHIERARNGETVVHEFRIQRPSDKSFRWIRNIDFPLRDARGEIQRIGGIAEDITAAKLSVEHQGVLLAELQHRVRNIMAIIRSITARTGRNATSVQDYAATMAGRLMTLARVQTLLTRAANVGANIATIVQDEIAAQAQHASQYTINGPDVTLSPKAAEVLTLALHELATNALKYGALSVPEGHINVTWTVLEKRDAQWVALDWNENGAPASAQPAPPVPRRRGFGSELIEMRIPYELGGSGRVMITAGGAQCHLEFPLKGGASILETDAPQHAAVFGGALDMTGEADLSGQRILVMEDDYYLASDTVRALQGAGAETLGPCPSESAAFEALGQHTFTSAVVDINLGTGPSFRMAAVLKQRGVPFIFVTGYDEETIPLEFDGVPRLQKPIDLKQMVNTLAHEVAAART